MHIMRLFRDYARDFELTVADDDWGRLGQYFADDAVYEVEADIIGCRLIGRAAIFAGIKKSLDGFDRKFANRSIAVTSGPEVSGEEMRLGWESLYSSEGLPPFVLRGRSIVRTAGGRIVYLADIYDPSVNDELAAWQSQSGVAVDPSYT